MTDESAGVFRALADPTRRQILQDLRDGEKTAGGIASRFTISGPSISRHLSILRAAGLVTERRDANRIFYALVEDRLAKLPRHADLVRHRLGGPRLQVDPSRSERQGGASDDKRGRSHLVCSPNARAQQRPPPR